MPITLEKLLEHRFGEESQQALEKLNNAKGKKFLVERSYYKEYFKKKYAGRGGFMPPIPNPIFKEATINMGILIDEVILNKELASLTFPTIEHVRAAMLSRINVHANGHSGCRPEITQTFIEMLNKDVTPVVCSKGSVGACGDLSPMSQIALLLLGEGSFLLW